MNRRKQQAPTRHISPETKANIEDANNITEEKPQTVVQNEVQSEVQTAEIDITPVKPAGIKNTKTKPKQIQRKNKIIVRLSDNEYKRLLDFVNYHTPRTNISEVVRSGIENIIENAKQRKKNG